MSPALLARLEAVRRSNGPFPGPTIIERFSDLEIAEARLHELEAALSEKIVHPNEHGAYSLETGAKRL